MRKQDVTEITKKIICGFYARDSTDKQGDTVENQISQGAEFIRRLGPEYILDDECIFIDHAVSGYYTSVFDREAMKNAVELAKQKRYDVLVFKEVSRVGRDKQENPAIVGMFEQYGIRVIAINDNYDSLNKDNITFGILSVLAEQESRKTSVRVSTGKREKARRGLWNTTAPIGYVLNSETRKLVIDQNSTEIVEEIFELYANHDIGTFLIAQKLNSQGKRTRKGNLFSRESVKKILKNPVYIGHTVYGKKRNELERTYDDTGKMSKKKVTVMIDRKDWLVVENTHESIINEEMFFAVQEKLNKRGHHRKPRRAYHPLTGILYCGDCGQGMVCQKRSFKNKEYRYYICKTYHKYGRDTCSRANVNADKLESEIITTVKNRLVLLQNSEADLVNNRSEDIKKLEDELVRKSKEHEKIKKDQMDIFQQRELFSENAYKAQMLALKDRSIALEEEIRIVNSRLKAVLDSENQVANVMQLTKEILVVDPNDTDKVRALLHQIIGRIEIKEKEEVYIDYQYDII
ncbi:Recombinase [compost metagenome]